MYVFYLRKSSTYIYNDIKILFKYGQLKYQIFYLLTFQFFNGTHLKITFNILIYYLYKNTCLTTLLIIL
jgi:hypothetical protein